MFRERAKISVLGKHSAKMYLSKTFEKFQKIYKNFALQILLKIKLNRI